MNHKAVNTNEFILAVVLFAIMSATAFFAGPSGNIEGHLGICLPSPNLWGLSPLWQWGINTLLILITAMAAYLFEKKYNFVRLADLSLPAFLLVLTATVPWITAKLGSSVLMALVNIFSLSILFGCYKLRNATQQCFVIATWISIGSMIQYAFLFMVAAVMAGMFFMKIMRVKELLALLMGLVAPYWVVIGFGIVPLDSFRMPELTNLFSDFAPKLDLLIMLISLGILILLTFIIGINNSVKLFAGNSKVMAMSNTINVLAIICVACMLLDFTNLLAYLVTFFFTAAVQFSQMFSVREYPRAPLGAMLIMLLCAVSFSLTIFL